MNNYKKIIERQRDRLGKRSNISWWPLYFYHFTDIQNAVNILDKEYIYGRYHAKSKKLMMSDNASSNVISITDENISQYVRLYMRPKTPTQYHNEGYKPKKVRKLEIDANCPVPIFFFLDAEKVLDLAEVYFIEKGLAGRNINDVSFLSGVEAFSKLHFDKIFHDGYFEPESDIKQYRHTEIIKENGILINGIIRGIACRSIAERQTLLYLLKKLSLLKYNKYRNIISYKPEIDIFFNNGIFIREVDFDKNKLVIKLNENHGRYNASNQEALVNVKIYIDWIGDNNEIINSSYNQIAIDYNKISKINYNLQLVINSKVALVEIQFDDNLMYKNEIPTSGYELV